ncbi:MAG: LPS export ABC transporter ATP-binding protein [Candidatus Kapabacteria bacterium]|nr:LPS export ABC transporter ATP-binding protein [Candidatus Kapabacteria bacterium]
MSATESGSVLRADGLRKTYKQRTVVKGSTLSVRQGECVGLLGPNGAGKTTTFYMMTGMVKPDRGNVYIDDVDVTSTPMYKRARAGLAYLPQEASIFRRLTVEQNIMAVLQLRVKTKAERFRKLEELLNEFGIAHIRKSNAYTLSGGERRRCEIARALATDPKFILLDEPFAGIDPIAVEDIMKIVTQLKHKGIGVLITDHNVHETLSITDRAYILIDGSIFVSGTAQEIAANQEVRSRYLGETFTLRDY